MEKVKEERKYHQKKFEYLPHELEAMKFIDSLEIYNEEDVHIAFKKIHELFYLDCIWY